MCRIFILTCFVAFSLTSSAQISDDHRSCGTISGKSEWLKKYQKNPDLFINKSAEEIYVPLKVSIVGDNDGKGFFSETTLLNSFCTLNQDFSESEMTFVLKKIEWIKDSDFFEHETALDGAYKMFEYNEDEFVNIYIVGNPAGNAGYNLPYAGIALSTGALAPTDHTWAHELGHAFSLPHPFLGWEGGIGTEGSTPNFNDPAPDTVLYDYTFFQDTLILDTVIIDTAIVERVDRSNCQIAGDGFCDTEPDYLASRWACGSDGLSFTEQTDPTGAKFKSDASLFMSYGFDACANRFSGEQIQAMRSNALDQKADIVFENIQSEPIAADFDIELYPPYDSDFDYTDIRFQWQEVENADYYLLQVGLGEGLNLVYYDTIISSNEVVVPELPSNFDLFWGITPFNKIDFCDLSISEIISFEATDVTSVQENLPSVELELIPNILSNGEQVSIISDLDFNTYEIYDLTGRKISSEKLIQQNFQVSNELSEGLYFVRFISDQLELTRRIFVK